MDPRQLLRDAGRQTGFSPIVSGIVSGAQPAPSGVGDPVFVVIPQYSSDVAIPVTRWGLLYGAGTFPAADQIVYLAYDQDGVPAIVWWGNS